LVAAQGISSSAEKQASPTVTACYVGKHVAEDPDTTRESETLGVIVFESGSGNLDGVPYSAALGPKTVSGVGDSPAYPYPTGGISNPATAILSTATMKGANGGWPILYGSNPVSASAINTAVDEDTLNDSERVHGQDKRTLAGSQIREQDVGFVLTRPDELSYGEVQFSTQPSRFCMLCTRSCPLIAGEYTRSHAQFDHWNTSDFRLIVFELFSSSNKC
jgi:hypothetical protein